MPKYFGSSKYRSFQKNLNLWGFKSSLVTTSKGECYHPLFVRGSPSLCQDMKRFVKSKERQKEINAQAARLTASSPTTNHTSQQHDFVWYNKESAGADLQQPKKLKRRPTRIPGDLLLDHESSPLVQRAASIEARTGRPVLESKTMARSASSSRQKYAKGSLGVVPTPSNTSYYLDDQIHDLQQHRLEQHPRGPAANTSATKMFMTLQEEHRRTNNQLNGAQRSGSSPVGDHAEGSGAPAILLPGRELLCHQWLQNVVQQQQNLERIGSALPTEAPADRRQANTVAAGATSCAATPAQQQQVVEDHRLVLLNELLGALRSHQEDQRDMNTLMAALQQQQQQASYAPAALSPPSSFMSDRPRALLVDRADTPTNSTTSELRLSYQQQLYRRVLLEEIMSRSSRALPTLGGGVLSSAPRAAAASNARSPTIQQQQQRRQVESLWQSLVSNSARSSSTACEQSPSPLLNQTSSIMRMLDSLKK